MRKGERERERVGGGGGLEDLSEWRVLLILILVPFLNSLILLTPLSAAGETKPPPPVPKRKSVRRSTTAPINRAESQSTDAHLSLAPPPVLPRQQSLKVQSTADVKKPPVAARRG